MNGVDDFDFLIGKWRVRHRRLKQPLANNHEWIEFAGTMTSQKVLGGFGNIDDNVLDVSNPTYRALALRAYDPNTKPWSIWWLDARTPTKVDPPVVGRFESGVGTFYGDDAFKGKPIRVRFFLDRRKVGCAALGTGVLDGRWKNLGNQLDDGFYQAAMRARTCCPVVELRQYTLRAGMRDALIELFERELIETQETTGMIVLGQFRDLDDPDRFVWLRGFSDMANRATALQEFYGGPVWKAHRDAANATMIDSDNVLLLRPARSDSAFFLTNVTRPPRGATETSRGVLVVTIYHLVGTTGDDFADFFERELLPVLEQTGTSLLASFVTERHPNTFPSLPVREDVNVFIWFSVFPNRTAWDRHSKAFADLMREWQLEATLSKLIKGRPEVLVLAPTTRSLIHG